MGITPEVIIYNKDSRFLEELQDNTVDFVVTSPPFNISHKYRSYHDSLDYDDFDVLYSTVINSISRVLKDDGFFIIDIADLIVMQSNIIYGAEYVKEKAFSAKLDYICAYPYIAIEGSDIKMSSSISRDDKDKKFHSSCEQVLVFGKRFSRQNIATNMRLQSTYKYSTLHDSAFWPKELVEDMIAPFEMRGKLLIDPFMGSGTIARITSERGGRFVGYDIDIQTLKTYNWR